MDKLIKLLQSLLTASTHKDYTDTVRVRLTPKVDKKTGQPFTYNDITSQVAVGTIVTIGDTDYRFEATPSGTLYKDRTTNVQTPQKYDSFSLVHSKAVDDWSTFDVVGA